MGKVRLKIAPSLAFILNARSSDWITFEKEVREGTTIGDLLRDFAFVHVDFHKMVFNPATGKISDKVNVVLNDNLLQFPDVTETKVKDGDVVILVPVYSGG
jgi:molybdopterin converting factor small subunit